MKKIILVLSYFILISCNDRVAREGEVIISVYEYDVKYCKYEVTGRTLNPFNSGNAYFLARKGLYNVGDTLRYCK